MISKAESALEMQPTVTSGAEFASTVAQQLEGDGGEQPSDVATGTDRFAPIRKLGEGGMGVVFEAEDHQFGRRVALKQLTGGTGLRRRFVAESVVTANLEHPGIAPVYERGRADDGTPFYAMRFVEGQTLTEAIARRDSLAERLKLLPSVVRVAHTLGFAHEHNVVHRDVKPDNVVLGRHGETVLLDWGIAKVRGLPSAADVTEEGPAERKPDVTRHGAIIGTPAYMAPEQAAGDVDRIDERTDVFALGALLYHLLTGRPPFDGELGSDILDLARQAKALPIRRLAPKAPAELCAIAERAMSRSPADRYQKASEVAEALESYVSNALVGTESRWITWTANLVGLAAVGLIAFSAVVALALSPAMRDLGIAFYFYTGLFLAGVALTLVDWRTRGRYRLGLIVLGFAVTTLLLGVANAFTGFDFVLQATQKEINSAQTGEAIELLLFGTRTAFGNIAPSSTYAALLLLMLALVTRANLRWQERAAGAGSAALDHRPRSTAARR